MKLHLLTSFVLATSSLAFAAGDNAAPGANAAPAAAAPVTPEEKAAISNFKTQIEETSKWIEEKQKEVTTDPAAGIALVGDIIAKLKAIKSDGLPTDLKDAWGEMTVVLGEMGEVFKGMPKMDGTKPEEMQKVMGEFLPKMMAIQGKVAPVSKKLKELGTKYGVEMGKVAPGN